MSKEQLFGYFEQLNSITDFLSLLAPFIFFVAGLSILIFNRYQTVMFNRRCDIPVEAKITKSELIEYVSHTSDSSSMSYRPVLAYTYEIDAKTYHSERIFYSSRAVSSNRKLDMEAFVQKYPVDALVTAFVSTENKDDAYLEKQAPGEWLFIAVGCALLFIGLIIYAVFS